MDALAETNKFSTYFIFLHINIFSRFSVIELFFSQRFLTIELKLAHSARL